MPNKKFLEEYPLYKRFDFNLQYKHLGGLEKPAIHLECKECKSDQTFNMTNEYYEGGEFSHDENIAKSYGQVFRAKYKCSACSKFLRYFFITFSEYSEEEISKDKKQVRTYIVKVGQYPSWSINIDGGLEKLLGEHSDSYKKGLIAESQGYGIGAYAYFRRVTENIIGSLLGEIPTMLYGEEKIRYEQALVAIQGQHTAEQKIALIKDLLPESLRPEGLNPLDILYSALSDGLHAQSDEKCLHLADRIKNIILYLVNELERHKTATREFTASMRDILDERAARIKGTS